MKRQHLIPAGILTLLVISLLACGMRDAPGPAPLKIPPPIPRGLDLDLLVPPENPMTIEKAELGRLLFFDPRLSRDATVSCATCHIPDLGFSDGLPTSTGIANQRGKRNAPTVVNSTYLPHQFWDGRAATLEDQALGPIQNPIEMGHTLEEAVSTLKRIDEYQRRFQEAFGTDVTAEGIAQAIATFERTLLSGNSPWDRFQEGDQEALGASARRGWDLFRGKTNCTSCHVGSLLTDFDFHNIGVGMEEPDPDTGRFQETGRDEDRGAFKTPGLRDVTLSGPYMHDGSMKTLEEVIDFYDRGGEANRWLDDAMIPLNLTEQEKKDLLAFLRSLEGDPPITAEAPPLPDLVPSR